MPPRTSLPGRRKSPRIPFRVGHLHGAAEPDTGAAPNGGSGTLTPIFAECGKGHIPLLGTIRQFQWDHPGGVVGGVPPG